MLEKSPMECVFHPQQKRTPRKFQTLIERVTANTQQHNGRQTFALIVIVLSNVWELI